jgi:hypothetical protein
MEKQTYEFTEEGKKHFAKIHRCIYCKKKLKKRGYGYGESSLNGYCSYAHDNCIKQKGGRNSSQA